MKKIKLKKRKTSYYQSATTIAEYTSTTTNEYESIYHRFKIFNKKNKKLIVAYTNGQIEV